MRLRWTVQPMTELVHVSYRVLLDPNPTAISQFPEYMYLMYVWGKW